LEKLAHEAEGDRNRRHFLQGEEPQEARCLLQPAPGLPVDEQWNGCKFGWRELKNPKKAGCTAWSPFDADTDYFGSRKQGHMINYRVSNLKKMLAQLKKEGVRQQPSATYQNFRKGTFRIFRNPRGGTHA
jgi:hypothetical protein